jgi:hypothetical protein
MKAKVEVRREEKVEEVKKVVEVKEEDVRSEKF